MRFTYKKELYPKAALIKAAYHFTDAAYLHLDADETYYIVTIEAKEGHNLDSRDFENEILAQIARYEVFQQTKDIREISLARALASSVVDTAGEPGPSDENDVDADKILKDWFQK